MNLPFSESVSDSSQIAVGIDIGGTHVKVGLVSEHGKILDFQSYLLVRDNSQGRLVIYLPNGEGIYKQTQTKQPTNWGWYRMSRNTGYREGGRYQCS